MTNKFVFKLRRLNALLKEMGMTSVSIHCSHCCNPIKETYEDACENLHKQTEGKKRYAEMDIAYNAKEFHLDYVAFEVTVWTQNTGREIVCDISDKKWEVIYQPDAVKDGKKMWGVGRIEITEEFVDKVTDLLEQSYIIKKREEIVNQMAKAELQKVYDANLS